MMKPFDILYAKLEEARELGEKSMRAPTNT